LNGKVRIRDQKRDHPPMSAQTEAPPGDPCNRAAGAAPERVQARAERCACHRHRSHDPGAKARVPHRHATVLLHLGQFDPLVHADLLGCQIPRQGRPAARARIGEVADCLSNVVTQGQSGGVRLCRSPPQSTAPAVRHWLSNPGRSARRHERSQHAHRRMTL
jgi:hypothetical protein